MAEGDAFSLPTSLPNVNTSDFSSDILNMLADFGPYSTDMDESSEGTF